MDDQSKNDDQTIKTIKFFIFDIDRSQPHSFFDRSTDQNKNSLNFRPIDRVDKKIVGR